ncbi:MAG: CpaF family protein [Proteobacteria bacterium]|nr:CpaF family protein [Pseudomonadota bacterium]
MKIGSRLGHSRETRREAAPAPRPVRRPAGLGDALYSEIYIEVIDRLETRGALELDPQELMARVTELVAQAVEARRLALSSRQREQLVAAIGDEILGLGPLEPLLADATISDILVNAPDQIFVERGGVLEEVEVRFRDQAHLLNTINRIVARVGRRIDEASPMVDARLPDGSRFNAVVGPLAIDSPVLSIRRFIGGPVSLRELVERGTLSVGMGHYLKSAVRAKCNVLVCGGTGAGKTTLLNALSRYVSSRERVVTIEDSAELRLQQRHVVRLETRPPNLEGRGEVTIRDLVRNALRMRPDRIIIGEVRGPEVLDMVQAMNTGHEGSMTTLHANSVSDGFSRLLAMLSMSGTQLSEPMMAQLIARAIDVVVHVARAPDGRRRVSAVAEVAGVQGMSFELNEVYRAARGDAAEGSRGAWLASGQSRLLERFAAAGAPLERRWLAPAAGEGA